MNCYICFNKCDESSNFCNCTGSIHIHEKCLKKRWKFCSNNQVRLSKFPLILENTAIEGGLHFRNTVQLSHSKESRLLYRSLSAQNHPNSHRNS